MFTRVMSTMKASLAPIAALTLCVAIAAVATQTVETLGYHVGYTAGKAAAHSLEAVSVRSQLRQVTELQRLLANMQRTCESQLRELSQE